MNKKQGAAERDYRLVKAVFMTLCDKEIITDEELSAQTLKSVKASIKWSQMPFRAR